MFDIVKELVSKSYEVHILSDIEVLAYTKKEERTKVYRIVKDLKKPSILPKAYEHLREWMREKINSEEKQPKSSR
jgi:hypothetical protein